jgi:hypothetical protein
LSIEANSKENLMNLKPILGLAVLGLGATLSFAAPSQAAMLAGPQGLTESAVTLVAGFCGVGFHRGPYGGCVANGAAVVVRPAVVAPIVPVAPVVVVRPRVCPLGTHLGPAGRRCVVN